MDLTAKLATKSCSVPSPFGGRLGRGPGLKLLRIMKLTTVLILAAALHVSAAGHSQKITLSEKNASLEKVFRSIHKQTGFQFVYNDETISLAQKVTINVKDAQLDEVLNICFANQPLSYTLENNAIVVKQKLPPSPQGEKGQGDEAPPTLEISGTVLDPEGNPVIGASVVNKTTGKGTSTDEQGHFSLNVNVGDVLVFTSIGFAKQEFTIKNTSSITITLTKSASKLDEVQIIAYGTTTKRLSTGNISTVKASDIEKQPVNNPLLALQGRVPGLVVTQSTGLPGSGVTVRIQGQNSIIYGNDPLYVIDGVPFTSQLLPNLANILGGSGGPNINGIESGRGNPLSFINPADIESIEILKDADATAIYGSRAASGAILITTKKGKAGQTKVDINMQHGWGKVTRKLDMLNTQQYLQMRHEAKLNDNSPILPTDYDINGTWDTTRYTDWQKELIGHTANHTRIQASVSGGNTTTQFLVGAGYFRETTVFPGDFSDQKGSLKFSINHASNNQKFRFELSGNYLTDNNNLINDDPTAPALILAPNAPALYTTDGNLNWAPDPVTGFGTWANPLANLHNRYKNNTNNLLSNALVSYQIIKGLNIKSSFGYNKIQTLEYNLVSSKYYDPALAPYLGNFLRYALFGDNTIRSWIIEPQISFQHAVGKGSLEIFIGSTIQQNNSNAERILASGYNNDLVLEDIKAASTITVQSTIASVYKYNALFGRVNYNWQDKYIINLTARRDGSSRFGSQDRFHNFGSVGGAWLFSNEKVILDNLSFLSFGKLRGSYGTTGNDQIGDYQYLHQYTPSTGLSYQGAVGLEANSLSNPFLQWEETKKLQLGLDLGFFKDRILLNSSYYRNRSSNQLLSYSLPIITGFTSIARNFPATVQNTGWEFSLNTINVKNRHLSWSTNVNVTIPRNKLVDFPDIATSSYASTLAVGAPITLRKVYHFIGVDPATGVYQFADINGSPTFSPNPLTDQTILINTSPKLYGGFQNTIQYKRFQLDILLQFVQQKGLNYFFGNISGAAFNINQPTTVLQRWQKQGDITSIQRYNSDYSLIMPAINTAFLSDAAWDDASYIRLKNVSLSLQLPEKWKQKLHLQNFRLFTQGQNLLTITNYKGLDPETMSTTNLPPLKILTLGLQVTL